MSWVSTEYYSRRFPTEVPVYHFGLFCAEQDDSNVINNRGALYNVIHKMMGRTISRYLLATDNDCTFGFSDRSIAERLGAKVGGTQEYWKNIYYKVHVKSD